jgi:hypothetical protein
MNNLTSILGKIVNITKRGVCVMALVLLFLAVGVDSKPSLEARTQESPPMGDTDTNTAEVEVAPAEIIAPATATLSPEPNADWWNKEKVTVTLVARMKAHRIKKAS